MRPARNGSGLVVLKCLHLDKSGEEIVIASSSCRR